MMKLTFLTILLNQLLMLVGTYTDGGSTGIYAYRFDQTTGKAIVLDSLALKNPSYLTIADNGTFVYAVTETNDAQASLNTIRLNPRTGHMQLLGTTPTEGGDPCYAATNERLVLTANGRYLLCSCRDSNVIQVFERDAKTGLLTDTHQDIHLSKPVCVQFAGPTKAERVKAALHDSASPYVIVVSHRGDWRNYPENSIPAIESVIRMGVDVMELDLKKTKDGVLVLSHDWTLDRCTTGHGNICDYTYQELLAFDLKRGHGIAIPGLKIPTLRQALEVCKDRIVVNVDQGYDYYDEVLAITEELGMTDQVLIKSGKPQKEVDKKLAEHPQNMMYMPVISVSPSADRQLFNDYVSASKPPLAFELCFGKLDELVTTTAQQVVKAGSKVWINTIWGSLCGNYDDDRAFDSTDADIIYGPILALGTSIIQTDRPEFLIDYLKHKGRR